MTEQPRDTPQFYLTAPAPCPYLPGRTERKVFTHLVGARATALNDILTHGGFRRSQTIAYRPACDGCHACIPVRVVVKDFVLSRSFRRVRAANSDLVGEVRLPQPTGDQYALFRRYLDVRHAEGGMMAMTVLDYATMVEDSHVRTRLVEYRRRTPDTALNGRGGGPLLAAALTDILADGLSMVYSFYDPGETARSLGTYMILDHIARAAAMSLPYVYLGYWVEGSAKMDYKRRFRPQERLVSYGWEPAE